MSTLYHPHTGRAIVVDDAQASDWRDMGWLDEMTKPTEPDTGESAPAKPTEPDTGESAPAKSRGGRK